MKIGHENRVLVEALHNRLLEAENGSLSYKVRNLFIRLHANIR